MKRLSFLLLAVLLISCGGGGGGGEPIPPVTSGAPVVTVTSATSVSESGATLNGNVMPFGADTEAWFEWGVDPALATYTSTTHQPIGSGMNALGVTQAISGCGGGTQYYYRVCALNSEGAVKSSITSFTTSSVGAAPTVSTLAATSVGATTATLNGSVSANGLPTYAWFEYGADPTLTSSTITSSQSVGSGTTSVSVNATLTGLTAGGTYYYRVAASNSSGTTKGSILSFVSVVPPPDAPTGVTATPGPGQATIGWASVTGATSYNIYYSTTSPVTKATGTKVAGVTSPSIVSGLTNGTAYYFVVTAVNIFSFESAESTQVSTTPTPAPPPSPPTGVSATAGYGLATINWSPVVGATSYNIYYSTTSPVTKTSPTKLTGVTTIPRAATGLIIGTTYYFVVSAVNSSGESAISSQVSVIPSAEYIAVGDSITEGKFDDILSDGIGYEPILANLRSTTIANEGVGSVKSAYGAANISSTLSKYPSAKYFLVLYGTNDSDPAGPTVPSGLGLNHGDDGYDGSYKDNMQKIISVIKAAGKLPYLAKVLYIPFIPPDTSRDTTIQEYNAVIDDLVVANGISVTPPDFYNYFKNHQGEFADGLHPNGVGYQSMANLWDIALP